MLQPAPPWVTVATYGTVFEADFAAATLDEAGIPARVTGAHLGIWGAGYQGPSMYGVEVRVPYHRADDARRLLETFAAEDEEAEGDAPPEHWEEEDPS